MSCEYCGRKRVLADKKKYCVRCAANMVQECVRCHKPYHSMAYFSSDEHHRRCNSCHNKYEKEKMKNKMKASPLSKENRDNSTIKSEIEDSSSESSEDSMMVDTAGDKELPLSPSSLGEKKKSRMKKPEGKKSHHISESDDAMSEVEERVQLSSNIQDESGSRNVQDESETESLVELPKKSPKKMKKKSVDKDVVVATKKKITKKVSLKKSVPAKKNQKKIIQMNSINLDEMKQIGYIPLYTM